MGFSSRKREHDRVLREELPPRFRELGIHFTQTGYEATVQRDGLVITQLEDATATALRFRPDGVAVVGSAYFVELKTQLVLQQSSNYSFEMSPWEKARQLHENGTLVAYVFWPAMRVAWVTQCKPDYIIVPEWRWDEQDYLRIKHRYAEMCNVLHKPVRGGSGTVGGVIVAERIQAMTPFQRFWLEVKGTWPKSREKQLKLV